MLGMVVKSALAFSREVSTGMGKCTPTVTVTRGCPGDPLTIPSEGLGR